MSSHKRPHTPGPSHQAPLQYSVPGGPGNWGPVSRSQAEHHTPAYLPAGELPGCHTITMVASWTIAASTWLHQSYQASHTAGLNLYQTGQQWELHVALHDRLLTPTQPPSTACSLPDRVAPPVPHTHASPSSSRRAGCPWVHWVFSLSLGPTHGHHRGWQPPCSTLAVLYLGCKRRRQRLVDKLET